MSRRLFVALSCPPEVQSVLDEARRPLERLLSTSEVRWQDPRKSHLTLRFLGSVPDSDLAACRVVVEKAARQVAPIDLATGGYGAFPQPERPSVLWLGVEGELLHLRALVRRLETELEDLAESPPPPSFRPHLTLGRVRRLAAGDRRPLGALLRGRPPTRAAWRAERVQLIESHLGPGGPRYEVQFDAPLSATP